MYLLDHLFFEKSFVYSVSEKNRHGSNINCQFLAFLSPSAVVLGYVLYRIDAAYNMLTYYMYN